MSLAQIIAIPEGPGGWQEWTWAHYCHHQAILDAAQSVRGVSLIQYPIWPFSPGNPQGWLLAHQQMHNQMNQLYNIAGSDLSDLDFTNKKQLDAFCYLNYVEHLGVAKACGAPI